jgi:hypothetical protein
MFFRYKKNENMTERNSHLCVARKIERRKYILSSSLELVKKGGGDFPHPYDGLRKSHPFLSGPQ